MSFDIKSFLKTILIFALLSGIWTMLSIRYERFTENDNWSVTMLGYIVIFAASFYFGRKFKPFKYLFLLIVAAGAMFLFASFVLIFFANFGEVFYAIVSSAFTSFLLILMLDKFYGMYRKYSVLLITVCCGLIAYLLIFSLKRNIDFHGIFNIYQSFLLVPLAAGLSLRETDDPLPQ